MNSKFDKKFKEVEDLFNELLNKFNISQKEIDELSEKNGYFVSSTIREMPDINLTKELKIKTLLEHSQSVKIKIDQIQWHLSALNKLIKEYKNIE
jgi:hypothetical protein